VHQAAGGFGVEALVERRRTDEVGENDGDHLAGLNVVRGARARGDKRGAAGVAKLRVGLALAATGRAAPGQRFAAPAAEPCPGPVCFSTARAVHDGSWWASALTCQSDC